MLTGQKLALQLQRELIAKKRVGDLNSEDLESYPVTVPRYEYADVEYWATKTSHSAKMKQIMETVFGFKSFRLIQKAVINAILAGRDVFAVMPTGGGKSFLY